MDGKDLNGVDIGRKWMVGGENIISNNGGNDEQNLYSAFYNETGIYGKHGCWLICSKHDATW